MLGYIFFDICKVMTNSNLNLTPKQAIPKIKQFCAYQERCHKEVKDKLYHFGLNTNEVEHIITTLIEENYLNETRFATQYTLGKYRIKHWGRNKIKYQLQHKQISPYNINKALKSIDADEYYSILKKEALKHFHHQTKGITALKQQKTTLYLLQKGFEIDLIKDVLIEMSKKS